MKILVLNQFFWPDSSATSQLLTDLARGLIRDGHEVTAIAAARGGYAVSAESESQPAMRVIRIPSLPFVRGKLGRVLSYLSFYLGAAARGLALEKQDIVLSLTTPPLLSVLGMAIQTLRGSRHFIWEMDLYPDVALDLGYFRPGGLVERTVGAVADLSRRRATGIIALGECMKERLVRRGIPASRIGVADNWADGSAIQPSTRHGDPHRLVVLYSGNLGLAHDLDTVTAAMQRLRDDHRFHFLFVGSGGRRAELAAFVDQHQLQAVELRPYVQRQSLGQSLSAGDIGLVTQREACCGSVVPSKVYGLLAAGRPVLFVGPAAATPARIIARFGCGWHVSNGDTASLVALLQHLASHPEQVVEAGRRARATLLDHFDLPLGVARISALLGATPSPTMPVASSQAADHGLDLNHGSPLHAGPTGALSTSDEEKELDHSCTL